MKAMVLRKLGNLAQNSLPLRLEDLPEPIAKEDGIVIKISACGVCHTELDEIEGRTPPPNLPVVLGHQVVGRVVEKGSQTRALQIGDRVGVAWIYSACGQCKFCLAGDENLCAAFQATGRDANGGYGEWMSIQESFAYKIPEIFSDAEAAPLLCAGAIGYRSLRLANLQDGQNLGLTGFGGSAHLVLKMAKHKLPNSPVFVFARNAEEREFAEELGAIWAGDITEAAPEKLDAIIDTTPVWRPIVEALQNLAPGGRLIINAIRKEEADKNALLNLDYPLHLWLEKEIKSVANVTRKDVSEFLQLAAQMHIKPEIEEYELTDANRALLELKTKKIRGAKVLRID
jgi:propanol-preferring alcohol dehydrogenase